MDRQIILHWLDVYNREGICDKETEQRLGKRIQTNKKLNKQDLLDTVAWKFSGRLLGRRKRFFNIMADVRDDFIQEITQEGLQISDSEQAISKLTEIKGVGTALASCILSFYNPKDYCVYDIHLYDELFGTNSQTRPKDMFSKSDYYLKILEKLRPLAAKVDMNVRDVEKALFQKNYTETKQQDLKKQTKLNLT
jgi:thermostable 8-oxoguanine DNA glycosylase